MADLCLYTWALILTGCAVSEGLAHGNWAKNKWTDEQMKMDEGRLRHENGRLHERVNKQTAILTAGGHAVCGEGRGAER